MKTRRLNDSVFPCVWRRFSRTSRNGEILKFKIQDCPEEMYEDFLNFMVQYFMRDETWNKALGIEDEKLAVEEFSEFQSKHFSERLGFICLADDDVKYDMKNNKPKILGFSLCMVISKFDESPTVNVHSKAISKLFKMFHEMEKKVDIFERYNITEYLGDAGLSVHPDARGLGLAKELLLTRVDVAKSIGLSIVEATFTSSISQAVAEKCGFKTIVEVPYIEFEKTTNFCFNTDSKFIKMMAYELK